MSTPYPTWIHTRLENMFIKPPRYENSYYGPINAALYFKFPPGRQFLVKPQAVIRPSYPIESSIYLPPNTTPHSQPTRSSSRVAATAAIQPTVLNRESPLDPRISIDSTGDTTLGRAQGGWENALFIPDFLVVKGGEATDRDVILALVEVKLNSKGKLTSINQVNEYIDAIQSKNYADEFVAFLCMGPETCVWTTEKQGNTRTQVMQEKMIRTADMPFCNLLSPLRKY